MTFPKIIFSNVLSFFFGAVFFPRLLSLSRQGQSLFSSVFPRLLSLSDRTGIYI